MMRGTLVDQGRNHDVLECHSSTVEHESVTRRLPGWLPADDDFSEFGVHVAALHGTGGERMVEVADRSRLISTSTTTCADASRAGSISCLSGLSAPTAATNAPGAI